MTSCVCVFPASLLPFLPRVPGLSIVHLWAPEPMVAGRARTAILDCDYRIDPEDRETLEVKWYFRFDPAPIYQWVPPNDPQVSGGGDDLVLFHEWQRCTHYTVF